MRASITCRAGSRFWDAGAVLAALTASGQTLEAILVTHHHPDHVGGVRELLDGDRIEVFVHPADLEGVSLTLREAHHIDGTTRSPP